MDSISGMRLDSQHLFSSSNSIKMKMHTLSMAVNKRHQKDPNIFCFGKMKMFCFYLKELWIHLSSLLRLSKDRASFRNESCSLGPETHEAHLLISLENVFFFQIYIFLVAFHVTPFLWTWMYYLEILSIFWGQEYLALVKGTAPPVCQVQTHESPLQLRPDSNAARCSPAWCLCLSWVPPKVSENQDRHGDEGEGAIKAEAEDAASLSLMEVQSHSYVQ